jgi:hypothetical protein
MAVDTRAHLLSPPDKPAASLQSGADFRNVFASSFGDDAPALTILQNCRRAMGVQCRLLMLECGLPRVSLHEDGFPGASQHVVQLALSRAQIVTHGDNLWLT